MNLTSKPLLAGAGGLIVGALIGMGIGSSGKSGDAVQIETQRELAAGVGSLSDSLKGVDARIAALEERIDKVEGSVTGLAEAQTGRLDALAARLEGFGDEIGGQVSSLGGSVAASLGQGMDALKTELAAVRDRLRAPAGDAGGADAPAADIAAAAGSAAGSATGVPASGELVLIGSAASFGDALSVFVSAVNPEAGTARVAVNGPTTMTLALGEPAPAGECQVTLTGFGQGGAYIDGACGGEAAAPAAAGGGDAREAAAEGEPVRIGAAGSFGEGKVRIFVSGVDNEAKTARIALNGLRTSEVKLQDKVEAEGCAVTLTGINAEGATFKIDC